MLLLLLDFYAIREPGTSMSSVRLPYPYPELLQVLQDFHTLTRNPQTLQNITVECSLSSRKSIRLCSVSNLKNLAVSRKPRLFVHIPALEVP